MVVFGELKCLHQGADSSKTASECCCTPGCNASLLQFPAFTTLSRSGGRDPVNLSDRQGGGEDQLAAPAAASQAPR